MKPIHLYLTMGQIQVLARVIVNMAILTGRKSKILGYMSRGERVYKTKNYTTSVKAMYEFSYCS